MVEAFHLGAGAQKATANGWRWFRGRWMWPAVRRDRMGLRVILRQLGVGRTASGGGYFDSAGGVVFSLLSSGKVSGCPLLFYDFVLVWWIA